MSSRDSKSHCWQIVTDAHEILLFSLCIKSAIAVFKMTEAVILSAGKLSGVIYYIKGAK